MPQDPDNNKGDFDPLPDDVLDCGGDKGKFIEAANAGLQARVRVTIAESLYLCEVTAGLIFNKKFLKAHDSEPLEIKNLLTGKEMRCKYRLGYFYRPWLDSVSLGLEPFEGPLKDALMEMLKEIEREEKSKREESEKGGEEESTHMKNEEAAGQVIEWTTISRIGYAGNLKNRINAFIPFGDDWRKAHKFGEASLGRDKALAHYEEAYYQYFKADRDILTWLTDTASDVYDNSQSNVLANKDYSLQETKATHLQDIAIRKAVSRLGVSFKGKQNMKVRGKDSPGYRLNPGNVPFHLPDMILKPARKGWWKPGSIEDFWQSNKVLEVKKEALLTLIWPARKNISQPLLLEGKDYLRKNKFHSLSLVFCEFQSKTPFILGTAQKDEAGKELRYVIIPSPYEAIFFSDKAAYYEGLCGKYNTRDLLIRTGEQLPKGTLRKLSRFAKKLEFIS